jgi:hypothetical protein
VKDTLQKIDGCGEVKIYQSTLVSNEEWKNLGEGAAGRKRARSLRELNAGGADRVLGK